MGIDEVLVHGTEEAAEDAGVLHLLQFHDGLVVDGYEVVIPKSPDLEGRDVGKADVPRLHPSVGEFLVVDGQVGLVEESFLQERPEQHDAAAAEEHDAAPSHNQMKHVLVHVEDVDAAKDDMFLYQSAHSYFQLLNQKKESLLSTLAELQLVAEQKKAVVRAAMQREKVLDRLKDNKLASWKEAGRKEEELIVDDVVTAKYNKAQ